MRKLFFRLSWDKEFRRKFLIIAGSSMCALLVIVGLYPICSSISFNIDQNRSDSEEASNDNDSDNYGENYSLRFEERKRNQDNTNKTEDNKPRAENKSDTQSVSTSENRSIGSEEHTENKESGQVEHVHNWYTVVDRAAWTESVRVLAGTNYRCNNCGYTTSSAGAISSHCSNFAHSFSSFPVYETREVQHEAITHEECSCGARR